MKSSREISILAIAIVMPIALAGTARGEGVTTPLRAVTVQGLGSAPIAQGASATEADAAYRQALAAAIAEGQGKAEFLATKAGASLGTVQTIAEEGGSVQCSEGEANSYVEYTGAQPDFGFAPLRPIVAAGTTTTPAPARGAPMPSSGRHPKRGRPKRSRHHRGHSLKHRRPRAHKAAAASCTVSAQIALSYALG
jgi:hypothetical protein